MGIAKKTIFDIIHRIMQTELELKAPEVVPLGEAFHTYYDPNGYFEGDDIALVGWLYEKRHGIPVVVEAPEGKRVLTVREQLAFEMSCRMELTEQNAASWVGLGLTEDELKNVVGIAEHNARQTALLVKETVMQLRELPEVRKRIQKLEQDGEAEGLDALLAGAVVAALGHYGQERMNDVEFVTHPVSVTTILTMAMRKIKGYVQKIGALRFHLAQYETLTHDVDEDSIPDDTDTVGTSFWNARTFRTYPLLHKRVLEAVDVQSDLADETAQHIRALTKPAGHAVSVTIVGTNQEKIKTRMQNKTYMKQVGRWALTKLVKLADMHHNRNLDQKERPIQDAMKSAIWQSNQNEYDGNIAGIVEQLVVEGDTDNSAVGKAVLSFSTEQLIKYRSKRLLGILTTQMVFDAKQRAQSRLAA